MTNHESAALADILLDKAIRTGMLKLELRHDPILNCPRLVLMARACPGFPYFTITTLPLDTPKGPSTDAVRVA
jgi:hypothetical protein